MPIYEYRCHDCKRPFSLLVYTFEPPLAPVCPRCHGENVTRLISRFAVVRSEESRLDTLADSASTDFGDLDENDPRSIARWARKMGREMGEDLGPEFSEMVDRLETGESPESIEQSMGMGEGEAPGGLGEEL